MSHAGRTLLLLAVVLAAVFAAEVLELVLAAIRSVEFGIFLMTGGVAVAIWMRMDRLENETERPSPRAAAPRPALPRQRVSVEEGAS